MHETTFYSYSLGNWLFGELEEHIPKEFYFRINTEMDMNVLLTFHHGEWSSTRFVSEIDIPELLQKTKEVERLVYKILSDIQDIIAEFTTNVWPNRDVNPIKNLALPDVRFTDNIIDAKFVYNAEIILQLTPLDISTLPEHGSKIL